MNKYYFLVCSFPTIEIGVKPYVTFVELENYLNWNLTKRDKKTLFIFKTYLDIKNLKNIWMEREIDPRGNFDEKTFHELSLREDILPDYVVNFMKKFESVEQRIKNFSILEIGFLKYQIKNRKSNFLLSYFSFKRETKLVLTALRAKKLGRDISKELEGEDFEDSFVADILSQKDEKTYKPPKEYEELAEIYIKYQDKPKILYKAYLEYCFKRYSEFSESKPFTIDQILGYLANLILVEDYQNLDQERGNLIVQSLL